MKNSPFSVVAGGQHDTEQSWNNQQPHSKFIRMLIVNQFYTAVLIQITYSLQVC